MTQYKQWVFNKELSNRHRITALRSQNVERFNTELFLKLPRNIPKSDIVYGQRNESVRPVAVRIFRKYVKRGAPYEINVEWQTRNRIASWIESGDWERNYEEEDLVDL